MPNATTTRVRATRSPLADRPLPADALRMAAPAHTPRHVTVAAAAGALLGLLFLVRYGLRSFWLTDYAWEALPAMSALADGDLALWLERLPAYGGALLLEAPFLVLAPALSEDTALGMWRALAVPGLLLFGGLAVMAGRQVGGAFDGRRAPLLAAFTALVVSGSPVALLAHQFGHSEDLLVIGLALLGVVQAGRGRPVAAGICVGLAAAGKPSALVVVPVVLVAAVDLRTLARSLAAVVASAAVLLAIPAAFTSSSSVVPSAGASAQASGIFKPMQVFWFLGEPNPRWAEVQAATSHTLKQPDPALASWAQRLEPPLVGQLSHPLIVVAAFALALGFGLRRRRGGVGVEDLMLLAACALWWRCLLDTWNNPYYALGAVTALGLWEAQRRRPPLLAFLAGLGLLLTQRFANLPDTTPDAIAALYLAWAVPLGAWLAVRSLAPHVGIAAAGRVRTGLDRRLPTLAGWVAPSRPEPLRAMR